MTLIASSLRGLLRCPRCFSLELREEGSYLQCADCDAFYPVFGGRPVLLIPDHPLFPQNAYKHAVPGARHKLWHPPSANLSARRCLRDLAIRLSVRTEPRLLLLGSGTQRKDVLDEIDTRIVAVDIDQHADVDAFADAQSLPFRDGCFDAVIATAVLEHVLRPEAAMAEISRVLTSDGLLYSEIPFMQQVHEGAYDFTRYTLSGHRRLAEHFDEIQSGAVAGPGTALIWAVEHFFLAFLDGRPAFGKLVKGSVRILLGWLRTVDHHIAQRPAALDGASCTYFYGQVAAEVNARDREIVLGYRGAQRTRHV